MSRTFISTLRTQFSKPIGISGPTVQLLSGASSSSITAAKQSVQLSSPVLTFVRHATKRAAGSKTSNKDSRGRRLGSKKSDGQQVQVGEIIYRQRGTKIYPGENVGIGKDHTLYALEPGYVRFYLDPFHPKRKFAGVVLNKIHRLPTPHFFPTNRRFGRAEIVDPNAAEAERDNMSRKEYLLQDSLSKQKEERVANRVEKRARITADLQKLVPGLEGTELESAIDYLVTVRVYLSGGRSIDESHKFALREYKLDTNIDKVAGRITEEELASKIAAKEAVIAKLINTVAFNPEFNLTKYLTKEETAALRQEKIAAIKALYEAGPITPKSKKEIMKLINSDCFPIGYRVDLKRRYLKTIKPRRELDLNLKKAEILELEKKKKGSVIKRWNYQAEHVHLDFVPKSA
ncbi:mitochondrial 54S ribosomal protein bL27m [Magnusiomyces paraingens]|uniref:Large ribosomal subunit protein bL27m n=1 Tax=Magnusiomyces paraingens TaxID=2606893 RepID=A0A5E8BWJ7_9ASCO|nr:uncharacterized protein SAPINGB_P004623 [Saprochaete ingens]VVT55491.1 unnamed protein product [Saprochaete ingens]